VLRAFPLAHDGDAAGARENGVTQQYALGGFFGPDREELLSQIPHAATLGMKVVEAGAAFAILKLPYRPELIGDPVRRVVFGGVITTLLDQALGLAVSCSLEDLRPIATLDLRIDYLRPAEPGADLIGRADCYKVTRNVAFARAVAYERDQSDPFATSLATFMLGSSSAESAFAKAVRSTGGKT
jgi:uncharacterized protein (TIGR00369 family)